MDVVDFVAAEVGVGTGCGATLRGRAVRGEDRPSRATALSVRLIERDATAPPPDR
ncbi:hypothetical protein [Glycomyces sp. YM15]|uniref:hypothetical protein n=1 Tax=Glycomyces sp. YM15 TaxID=2800446 RepID=UPI0019668FF3|nr:hypothetical protein [Glycomyces sp. YM15]